MVGISLVDGCLECSDDLLLRQGNGVVVVAPTQAMASKSAL